MSWTHIPDDPAIDTYGQDSGYCSECEGEIDEGRCTCDPCDTGACDHPCHCDRCGQGLWEAPENGLCEACEIHFAIHHPRIGIAA